MDSALKALAEPRRREILALVWSRELPASDIAAHFEEVTRSAISQHVGVLREARLLIERRDGTRRLYKADHHEMARLRAFLDQYWPAAFGDSEMLLRPPSTGRKKHASISEAGRTRRPVIVPALTHRARDSVSRAGTGR